MNRETTVNSLIGTTVRAAAHALKLGSALALAAVLAACSGGGAATTENPVTSAPRSRTTRARLRRTPTCRRSSINLWENIKANNRCGGCHNADGQTPMFARNDDVNLAYQAANTVVNLAQPDQSRMVIKVARRPQLLARCRLPRAVTR